MKGPIANKIAMMKIRFFISAAPFCAFFMSQELAETGTGHLFSFWFGEVTSHHGKDATLYIGPDVLNFNWETLSQGKNETSG